MKKKYALKTCGACSLQKEQREIVWCIAVLLSYNIKSLFQKPEEV